MKLKTRKLVPLLLCGAVAGFVSLLAYATLRIEAFDLTRRLEWITFDWRVRYASRHPLPHAPNLGFVSISDETIERVGLGQFGYTNGLYWPRHVYGRIVQELANQGAEVIAFDVLFPELRPDHPTVTRPDGTSESSDGYFARAMREAGNVVLGAGENSVPPGLFRTNAVALGDLAADRERDGILRRARAFHDYVIWHPSISQAVVRFTGFEANTNRIIFPGPGDSTTRIPIAADGTFDLATLREVATGTKFAPEARRTAKAFSRMRVWDLGIVVAAKHLQLDLDNAVVDPGRILLRSTNGVERIIPIDHRGRFLIDWSLTSTDLLPGGRLEHEGAHSLLRQHQHRLAGNTNEIENLWFQRLAIVGSTATGNDLTDTGATPLENQTFLTSRYWNVANSLILGRFIQKPSLLGELCLIVALSALSGILSWNLRDLIAAMLVMALAASYLVASTHLYVEVRYWLPLVLPLSSLFLTHFALVSYRVVVEKREHRRIRGIFSKIVSPNVVNELLEAEHLSLGGAQREITVFFSDVRGFTEMTDETHARAEEFVRQQRLEPREAELFLDAQAKEVLKTVNLYLGTIADTVKKHEGTLDKYIGDCVMAFWGAPTPNDRHALSCVRAAIDAQRAIHALNQQRNAENQRREQENIHRAARAEPAIPLMRLLAMGTGINTGMMTVGLMGSEQHTFNYTVFGREVNLASRLEGLSGRGRVLIGEATYKALERDDPALAATCRELAPTTPKGFRTPVRIFEVPWRTTMVPAETSTTGTPAARSESSASPSSS